jgi:hypothetical protein
VLRPATSFTRIAQARGDQPEESIAISVAHFGAPRTGAGAWRSSRRTIRDPCCPTECAPSRTLPSRTQPLQSKPCRFTVLAASTLNHFVLRRSRRGLTSWRSAANAARRTVLYNDACCVRRLQRRVRRRRTTFDTVSLVHYRATRNSVEFLRVLSNKKARPNGALYSHVRTSLSNSAIEDARELSLAITNQTLLVGNE